MGKLRVSVLISGRGSNLQALLQAQQDPSWPATIVLVVSNEPRAPGLDHARAAGVKASVIDHRRFASRQAFEERLDEALESANVELVCLAGFMRLLTAWFVDRWADRLINIHPSLLPAYKGLRTHERVLADGASVTGCTVHFVRTEMDSGPIILQETVPVRPGDSVDTLAARVLQLEHKCYPMAVRRVAEEKAVLTD